MQQNIVPGLSVAAWLLLLLLLLLERWWCELLESQAGWPIDRACGQT